MNGSAVTTWPAMRTLLSPLHVGDTVSVVVRRPTGRFSTRVDLAPYDRPTVRLTPMAQVSPKQKAIRERWLEGW
jgi:hypothetical protein